MSTEAARRAAIFSLMQMTRGPDMERTSSVSAPTPTRFVSQSPPSLLIVAKAPDLKAFLRGSLQRWYQVAIAPNGVEAAQHLEHCPPQGLIVGELDPRGEEALVAALGSDEAPAVLKLWTTRPPAAWADQTLRHPFMRVHLLRAVDQLVNTRGNGEAEVETNGETENGAAAVQNGA